MKTRHGASVTVVQVSEPLTIKFVLELDPVQPQSMQKGGKQLHAA